MYHVIKWKGGTISTFQGTPRDLQNFTDEQYLYHRRNTLDVSSHETETQARQKYQDLIDQVCPNCAPKTGYCTGRCI